jgi:Icc protein
MSITIAQLTDTHLLPDPNDRLRGCRTWYTLQAVLEQVATTQPNYLLLTDDLADTGSAQAYQHLLDLITPLAIPTYWLPGNHDRLNIMQTALHHPLLHQPELGGSGSISLDNWQLILLNSVLPTAKFDEGSIPSDTLDWLAQELERHPDQFILIALHHHPVPTHIDWVDRMQVQNSERFLQLLHTFPQVQVVVFGHIHRALQAQHRANNGNNRNTINFYGCPSTCLQVIPQQDLQDLTPEDHQPGFRLLQLHANGSHNTKIQRVAIDVATP